MVSFSSGTYEIFCHAGVWSRTRILGTSLSGGDQVMTLCVQFSFCVLPLAHARQSHSRSRARSVHLSLPRPARARPLSHFPVVSCVPRPAFLSAEAQFVSLA